jgi:carbonic anhydrase/acetyltransferase-like protein (isoleucine patch superfamily)
MAIEAFSGIVPKLGGGVFVHPTATVIGDVTLGDAVSVWPGAVIRGDVNRIRVGEASNIQDNAVIHADPGFPTLIGRNCTIGHGAVVHGCTVGDGALIGMHAVVLNGARIGAEAVVAAGAVVTANTEIPPGTLAAGVPARVIRELDPEARAAGAQGAARYRERARAYKAYFSNQ